MEIICESCGREFPRRGSRGRVPRFCGQTCRKRASRAARGTDLQVDKKPWSALVAATRGRWTRADVFGDDTKGKRPKQVNGRWASSTNPATWSNFEDVQTGPGVGFGVMVGNGVGVYDMDGALTESGDVQPWAQEALNRIEEPILFAEVSVSGHGVHVFVKAGERRGKKSDGVEFYSRDRFIRTTLQPFDMGRVVDS